MVSPQYAVIALAVGAVCAVAYTLYTSFAQRPARHNPHERRRRSRDGRNERANRTRMLCEICQRPVLTSTNLACGHNYHRSCLLKLDEASNTIPHVCISCWTPFTAAERSKIITTDNEVCTICLFAVEEDSFILDCGHEFHRLCALQLLNHGERSCPNCRDHLSTDDLRRLASGIS